MPSPYTQQSSGDPQQLEHCGRLHLSMRSHTIYIAAPSIKILGFLFIKSDIRIM